jgi:hypothetical protein
LWPVRTKREHGRRDVKGVAVARRRAATELGGFGTMRHAMALMVIAIVGIAAGVWIHGGLL